MRCKLLAAGLVPTALLAAFYFKLQRHESTGLAPRSGSRAKVATAFALVSAQSLRPTPSGEELEGWHDDPSQDDRLSSEFWGENLYFWANTRPGSGEEFIYSVRLSFVGANSSSSISWFTFQLGGEQWDLPREFDAESPGRTGPGGPREVASPGLGTLRFDLDEALQQWTVSYEGVVVSKARGTRMYCRASFVVRLNPKNVYHFSSMADPLAMARSMSRKPWSRGYFETLRSQKQYRYSSLATQVTGSLSLSPEAGAPPVASLPDGWVGDGSRDHNWGVRKWSFIWRYVWFPPVRFAEPLAVRGLTLTSLTGVLCEYGTLENAVVGGLLDDSGGVLRWTGSTPLSSIAPKWFAPAGDKAGPDWGGTTLPGEMKFTIGLGDAEYLLDISVQRGAPFGLWSNPFRFKESGSALDTPDVFEAHEAQTRWSFALRTADGEHLQSTTGVGLLEFGANLGNDYGTGDI